MAQARALEGLGNAYVQEGEMQNGVTHLRQALDIYERIGVPDAQRVKDRLHR